MINVTIITYKPEDFYGFFYMQEKDLEPTDLASINGQIGPMADAVIPISDRGFLYGDQIIETMLVFHGKVVEMDGHLTRLLRSLKAVDIPAPISKDQLAAECCQLAEQCAYPRAMLRLIITRGLGSGIRPQKVPSRRYILIWKCQPADSDLFGRGLRCFTKQQHQKIHNLKTGFYLPAIGELTSMNASGLEDIVWVTADQEILEASTANIFFVKKDATSPCLPYTLVTPRQGENFCGLSRAYVLKKAVQLGAQVEERKVVVSELGDFSECFVSSSVRGLVPVSHIDGHRFRVGAGKLFALIQSHYIRHIESFGTHLEI